MNYPIFNRCNQYSNRCDAVVIMFHLILFQLAIKNYTLLYEMVERFPLFFDCDWIRIYGRWVFFLRYKNEFKLFIQRIKKIRSVCYICVVFSDLVIRSHSTVWYHVVKIDFYRSQFWSRILSNWKKTRTHASFIELIWLILPKNICVRDLYLLLRLMMFERYPKFLHAFQFAQRFKSHEKQIFVMKRMSTLFRTNVFLSN